MKIFSSVRLAAICGWLLAAASGHGQGTAFTYQGRLNDGGQPANGVYDFSFALFDAGNAGNQVGGANNFNGIEVTNGAFTVALDFGGNFPGADRWLEIAVQATGGGGFTTLSPRQKLTATPYAITAANLTGGLPAVQLSGTAPPSAIGSFTNHSDVVTTGLVPGQGIFYSGAVWTNGAVTMPSVSNNVPVWLGYSGTNVWVDASAGTHFRLSVTNNFLLLNPSNAADAQRMIFEFIQDTNGGHTMSLGGAFKLGTDVSMVNLSTNAGRRDFLTCVSSGTNFYVVGFVKGY